MYHWTSQFRANKVLRLNIIIPFQEHFHSENTGTSNSLSVFCQSIVSTQVLWVVNWPDLNKSFNAINFIICNLIHFVQSWTRQHATLEMLTILLSSCTFFLWQRFSIFIFEESFVKLLRPVILKLRSVEVILPRRYLSRLVRRRPTSNVYPGASLTMTQRGW